MRKGFSSSVKLALVFILIFVAAKGVYSQATFSAANHITLTQQDIDVTFNQAVTVSGVTPTLGWKVLLNPGAIVVPITSVVQLSAKVVRVTFNASSLGAHTASQPYLKPTESLQISYNALGTLTSAGGVTAFVNQASVNNTVFDCSLDIEFFQQGSYAAVDICSPVVMNFRQWQFRISLHYINSTTWLGGANLFYSVIWGDAGVNNYNPFQSDNTGVASTTYFETLLGGTNPDAIYTIRPTHNYPAANPGDCTFDVSVTPFVNAVSTCSSIVQNSLFPTYDTDAANSGSLVLPPLVAGTDNVCLHTNVSMQFNDATLLNCRVAIEPLAPNTFTRFVRIVYGSIIDPGVGNIPDATVTLPAALGGGTISLTNSAGVIAPVGGYYPTGAGGANVPDGNGAIQIPSAVIAPTGTMFMGTIKTTSFANQVLNQKLWVRMDYWDVCNRYNGCGLPPCNPPVSIQVPITIIANNLAPTASPLTFCANQANGTYKMTPSSNGPSAGGTFKWYSDVALTLQIVAGPAISGSTLNPVLAPVNVNKNPAVLTTTNFYLTETIGNGCVSPAGTIPFTVVPSVVAGTLSSAGLVSPSCTGYDPPLITGTAATVGNGAFTYQWQDSPDNISYTNIGGATALNFDPPVITFTKYYRRVDSSGPCVSKNTNVITVQIDQLVIPGSIGTSQIVCTSSAPATFSSVAATGGNGTINYQWQSSTVSAAGPFGNIGGATSSTYASPALPVTTYFVRQASSGVCPGVGGVALSNVITVTVHQLVNGGSVSSDQIICSTSTPAPLASVLPGSGGDGVTYTYAWQQSTVAIVGPFAAALGANTGLPYAPPALTQTTYYRRQTTSGNCPPQFSNVITITVNPLPTANVTGGGSVCSGVPAPDVVFTFTGTGPYTLVYAIGGVNQPAQVGITSPFNIVNPAVGVYTITSITDNNTCVSTSPSANITGSATVITSLTPAPTVDAFTVSAPVCNNGVGTVPPIAILDLAPNSVQNYDYTYNINGNVHTFLNQASTVTGVLNLVPPYTDWGSIPGSYVVTVTALKNTATGCAGAVPFSSPLLVVNPRPAAPTGPVGATGCSSGATGAMIKVTDPGVGFTIQWFTNAAGTIAAVGFTGGVRGEQFTPTSTATVTYFAFTFSTTAPTLCQSSTGTSVTHTQDLAPAAAVAGPNQPLLCTTTATLAGTPANNGGNGTWTVFAGGPAGITAPTLATSGVTGLPLGATTFRWTVKSALNVCAQTTNDVILTRNPLPTAVDPLPHLCEDVFNGKSHANVDLTTYNAAETNAPTVAWYSNPARTAGFLISSNVTVINPTALLFYSINTGPGPSFCTSNGQLTFTIDPLPTVVDQNLSFCENIQGTNQPLPIDLTTFNSAVANGSVVNRTIAWFSDAALTTLVPTPMSYTFIGSATVYAKVTNTLTSCVNRATVNLTSKPRPKVNAIQGNASVCTGLTIILYQLDPTFNPGSNYTWTVVGTPAAAVTVFGGGGTNSPNFFVLLQFPSATGTVDIDVFETLTGCTGVTNHLTVNVNAAPAPNTISGANQVCANQTTVPYNVTSPNVTSTYTWGIAGATIASAAASLINVDFSTISPVIIQVTETSSTGCVGSPATKNVIVNPRPTMTSGQTPSTCSGVAPTLVFTSSIPSTFSWVIPPGGITGAISGAIVGQTGTGDLSATFTGGAALFNTSGAVGSVTFNVTPTALVTSCVGTPQQSVVLTVNPQPVMTSPNTNSICHGSMPSVSFTSNVPGSGFNWIVNAKSAFIGGANVGDTGVGNVTQTLTNLTAASGTITYRVTPTSPLGCVGAFQDVVITVTPQPVMTSSAAPLAICSGAVPPALVFTASVPSSTFAWSVVAKTGTSTGATIGDTGTGNLNQTLTNISGANATITYRVIPTTPAPASCVGAFQDVVITVAPQPVMTSAIAASICSGLPPPALTFTSNVPGSSFGWLVTAKTGTVTGALIGDTGSGNLNQTLTNTSGAVATVTYRVTPTGPAATNCIGVFQDVIVTVNPAPVMTSTAANTICSGSIPTVVFAANVASSTFAWSVTAITGTVTGSTVGNSGTGNINQTLTNTSGANATVTYRVIPTSPASNNCVGAFQDVIVTVAPQPVMTSTAVNTICSGFPPTVVFASNVAGSSFGWTVNAIVGTIGGTAVGNTGVGNVGQVLTNISGVNGTVTYRVIPTGPAATNCVGAFQDVVVTVAPQPVMTSLATNTICSGNMPSLVFTSNVVGASFGWQVITTTGTVGGASVGNTGVGNISQTLTNTSGANATVTYRVTPTGPAATNCVGAFQDVVITVVPQPVMTSLAINTICSGNVPSLVFTSNVAGSSFAWTVLSTTGTVTGTAVGNSGSGNINQTLTNVSGANATVTYKVTPTGPAATNCVGNFQNVTITVAPQPVMTSTNINTICSGIMPSLVFVSNVPISTFGWTVTAITGTVSGTALGNVGTGNINQVLTNTSGANATVTYNVIPTGPGPTNCVGAGQLVTVTIVSQPVMASLATNTICSGGVPTLVFTSNIAGSTFGWQVIAIGGTVGGTSIGNIGAGNISQTLTNTSGVNGTVTYRVTPTGPGPNNCVGAFQDVVITVVSEPVMTSAAINKICSGNMPSIVFTSNIVGSTFGWKVQSITGTVTGTALGNTGSGNISETLSNTSGANATVTYRVTPTGPGPTNCVGAFQDVIVTVVPQPQMTSLAVDRICSGNTPAVVFMSNVAGSSFAWQVTTITGAVTGATVGSVGVGNIGQILINTSGANGTVTYRVTPTGPGPDNCVGAFQDVVVTVVPQPVMTSPAVNKICSGNLPTVSFTSNVVGSSFSWQVVAISGTIGGTAIGNTGPGNITQTLTNTSGVSGTVTYRVTPKGPAVDNCVGAFQDVVVTVVPQPLMTSPAVENICSNSIPTTVFTSNVASSIFGWTVTNTTGSVTGASIGNSGIGNVNQTLSNISNANATVTYTVTATGPAPDNCPGVSQLFVVTVFPEPKGAALTTISRCSGQSTNFDLQTIVNNGGSGGNSVPSKFKYTLVADFPNDLSPVVFPGTFDRTVASSAFATETFSNYSNRDVTLTYTVTPISTANNCSGAPFVLKVVIHPEPVGTNFSDPVCGSTLNHNIQSQISIVSGRVLGSLFTYTVVSNNVGVPAGPNRVVATAANITDSYTNGTGLPAIITYTITPFNAANPTCGGQPFDYVVNIAPTPIGAYTLKSSVCSDSPFSINPQASITNGVASTFTWTVTYDPGLVVRTAGVSGNTIAETLTNTTTGQLKAHYAVTPTSGTCTGLIFTIDQPIDPEPVMDPALASKTICSSNAVSNNPTNITLANTITSATATSYTVTLKSQDPGLTGAPTTGTGSATLIKNDIYNNLTATSLKVVYTVVPHAGSCDGDPFDITVIVNPEPVISTSLNNTVCSKDISNIVLATNGTSVVASFYKLISVTVPGTITANGSNKVAGATGGSTLIQGDKYINTTNSPAIVQYKISGVSASNCEGLSQTINLIVNPEPTLSPGLATTCSGSPSGITLSPAGGPAITSYQLQSINPNVLLTAAVTNIGPGTYASNNFLFNDKFTNTTTGALHVIYTIIPVSGLCVGNAQTVDLTVNPAPAMNSGLNKTVCTNQLSGMVLATETAPMSVAAANYTITNIVIAAGLTRLTGNAVFPRTTANPNDIVADSFSNPTNVQLTVTYTVVPISAAPCSGPSRDIVLTVEPTITLVPNNLTPNICSGVPTNINITSPTVATAGSVTMNYSVTVSPTAGSVSGYSSPQGNLPLQPGGFTIADNLINNSNVVQTVTYHLIPVAQGAKGGAGCTGANVDVPVSVEPTPKINTISNKTYCEGVALNLTMTSPTIPSSGGIVFDISSVVTGGVTGNTNSAGVANGSILNDVLNNPTAIDQTVTYTITPRAPGVLCTGNPMTFIVTVSPRPNLTPIPDFDICSGDAFPPIPIMADTETANPGFTFIGWIVTPNPTVTGESSGAGNSFSQLLYNNSAAPVVVNYMLTAKNIANSPACAGTSIPLNITVYPTPRVTGLASFKNVCNNGMLNLPLTSSAPGITNFTWIVDNGANPDLPVIPNGGGPSIVQTFVNNSVTSTLGSYTYTITPIVIVPSTLEVCTGNDATLLVNVAPAVVGKLLSSDGDTDSFICKPGKDFLAFEFDGLPLFDATYTDGTTTFPLIKKGGSLNLQVSPTITTTYTLLTLKDGFGCVQTPPPAGQFVTINVGTTDASFSILSPLAACTPNTTVFSYNQKIGDSYRWQWGDGTADSIYTAAATQAGKIVKHRFVNSSLTNTLKANVFLYDSLAPAFPNEGCRVFTKSPINVYAQVKISVSIDKPIICSGDVVKLSNQTVGVSGTGHNWTITGAPQYGVKTSINASYTLTIDSTKTNPFVYDIVYKATNGHCPADTTIQVTVYKSITANFNEVLPLPFFLGGNATVTFNNLSKATIDKPQFQFDWDFGLDAAPATLTSAANSINVNYSSPGPRDITLIATNIAANLAGLTCSSKVTKTINILLKPLVADFVATPQKACFPSSITITQNLATGDVYLWQVVDQNGKIAATSNAPLPVFSIPTYGTYSIYLKTSNSLTGQFKDVTQNNFEIYNKPLASFQARPGLVYVPDTELTTFNFSRDAASYQWDFADGTTSTDFAPTHIYKVEGIYNIQLIAEDDHGGGVICKDTITQKIVAKQGGTTKVPNAFTPSPNGPSGGVAGNGSFNDVFLPIVKGVEEFNMQVFDRWGNLIFESNNSTIGWDGYDQHGKLLPMGVYVYKLSLRLSDGQRTTQVGDITMIR